MDRCDWLTTKRAEVRSTAASYAIGALTHVLGPEFSGTDAERLARIGEYVERLDRAFELTFADDFDPQSATDLALGRDAR